MNKIFQSKMVEFFDAQRIMEANTNLVWERARYILRIAHDAGWIALPKNERNWQVEEVTNGNEKSNDYNVIIKWSEYFRGDVEYTETIVPHILFVYGNNTELNNYFQEQLYAQKLQQERRQEEIKLEEDRAREKRDRQLLAELKAKYES